MSTSAVINFCEGNLPEAKVYLHWDGYPDTENGILETLKRFFNAVQEQTANTYFNDPSYLASKFVVWYVDDMAKKCVQRGGIVPTLMDFTGIGICIEDPYISYEYFVHCYDKNVPAVTWKKGRN